MPHLMEEDADAAAPSGSSSSSSMSLLLLPGMSTTATTASTASNELKIDFNQQEQEEEQEDELRRGPPTADTPGGDCKSLCIRHQRMANGPANLVLQQSIESLAPSEQATVNTIWSLFSSSPSRRRLLILQGLLTIACPSQLTFLQSALTLEMRLDPLLVLPREISLKVFVYLDAISLGRAAQVNTMWRDMADDDILWRTMCEQHIERKCDRCGWGLPLLGERRRKARGAINALPARSVEKASRESEARRSAEASAMAAAAAANSNHGTPMQSPQRTSPIDDTTIVACKLSDHQHHAHHHPSSAASTSIPATATTVDEPMDRPHKRAKTESPAPSRASTPPPLPRSSSFRPHSMSSSTASLPPIVSTRPWKSVYCERLAIERNWRRGTCVATVLSGHTDSITCLQVAEDLPHPAFPILMTGSWDRSVRIWNLESGNEVGVLRGHTRGVRALQFDAMKLVTGSMDSTLKIWNWRTGECMRTLRGHRDAVICLTYDRQLLVSGSADSTIRVWDFGTGEGYTLRGHTEWVNSVALWDSKIGCGPGQEPPPGTTGSSFTDEGPAAPLTDPEAAKASAKGKYLFSASDDMTIRVWDLHTRECVRILKGHVAQVQSLRVITSDDRESSPSSTLSPPPAPAASSSSSRRSDAFSPSLSNRRAASSTESEDVSNRSQVVHGNAYEGFFDAAPASPSTSCAISDDRHQAQQHPIIGGPPSAASFLAAAALPMPDASSLAYMEFAGEERPLIVSASLDNTIKVWDVEGGACKRTMFGHIEGVWDVDVDKLRIVSASHDRTLKIWDKDSGRCLHTLVGHTSAVTSVTLQDQYVITGSDDATVRIWNFARNQPSPGQG